MPVHKIVLQTLVVALFGAGLGGCKPSGPPPDLIKTQRDALQNAKAVSAVQQNSADEQKKAVDEETK